MFCRYSKGYLMAITCLILQTVQGEAGCPRCAVIEEERAKEQAENPQPAQYYDDHKELSLAEPSQNRALEQEKGNNSPFFEEGPQETKEEVNSPQSQSTDDSFIFALLGKKTLLETLEGPFTILVPTNEALQKLPSGSLEKLTKQENSDELGRLINNHVVAKKLLKQDFESFNGQEIKALSGRNLTLSSENGKLQIDGAHVLDIEPAGHDGVIMLIDRVLN